MRHAWDSTLYYLDLADHYQVTQDSLNLRQEAQTALDNLDSIVRLDFSPAIVGGLTAPCRSAGWLPPTPTCICWMPRMGA